MNLLAATILIMPQNDDDWRLASQRIDAPLVTLGMLGGRSKEAWQSLGFSLVIDPFSAQVLAVNAIREAFQRFHETGDIGWSARDLFAIYNELDRIAGFDALYAIEEATTERPPEQPGTCSSKNTSICLDLSI